VGIKDDATRIVLCMEDGSIYLYERSHEDLRFDDEIAPSTFNVPESESHKLSLIERIKSWFKRPREDVNEPLIDNNEGDDQSNIEHMSVHIFPGTNLPTYTRRVLAEELEKASFQVSPIFEEVIRISKSQGVEAWDLETKMRLFGPFNNISFIERKAGAYSHVSSITDQVHDELMSKKGVLLDGTSIDLSRRTTVVQSSREDIIVAGNSCSHGFIQKSDCGFYDVEYDEESQEDSHSIYVINLKNVEYRRRLNGRNLDPERGASITTLPLCFVIVVIRLGLLISHDGRHVACLAGDFGSKIVVWNAYASERLLPDYNFLSLTLDHYMSRTEGIIRDVLPLIDQFGINFFLFRHPSGMSILHEAIYHLNNCLLKSILQYVLKKKIRVSLLLPKVSHAWTSTSSDRNVIQASIAGRSPKTLGVALKYLLKRVTHEVEVASILTSSLVDILQVYPTIFIRTIRDPRLLSHGCEIEVSLKVSLHLEFYMSSDTGEQVRRTKVYIVHRQYNTIRRCMRYRS